MIRVNDYVVLRVGRSQVNLTEGGTYCVRGVDGNYLVVTNDNDIPVQYPVHWFRLVETLPDDQQFAVVCTRHTLRHFTVGRSYPATNHPVRNVLNVRDDLWNWRMVPRHLFEICPTATFGAQPELCDAKPACKHDDNAAYSFEEK